MQECYTELKAARMFTSFIGDNYKTRGCYWPTQIDLACLISEDWCILISFTRTPFLHRKQFLTHIYYNSFDTPCSSSTVDI